MFKILWQTLGLPEEKVSPNVYSMRWGNRRMVTVVTPPPFSDKHITIEFRRPIEKGDLRGGELIPVTLERFKRRGGGKRVTHICLDHDGAEALHRTLGALLKQQRKVRFREMVLGVWCNVVSSLHRSTSVPETTE